MRQRDVSWTDDQGLVHRYPRAWHGRWFDAGRPSEAAVIAGCKVVLAAAQAAEGEKVKEEGAA